jgi:hypothetical protein
MTNKQNFHPSYLKNIIEKIELIPSNKLGMVLTQNNMGFCNLYFYKESFEIFDEATIEKITAIFQYFEHMITIYRHESELCGKDSSKRFILDYLNINRLMYTGRPELKDLMNVTKLMFKYYSSPLEDLYISKTVKSVIIKNVTVKEYNKKVKMEKSKKIISAMVQELLTNETKKEYDFTILSDYNKNFKPYKFTYE